MNDVVTDAATAPLDVRALLESLRAAAPSVAAADETPVAVAAHPPVAADTGRKPPRDRHKKEPIVKAPATPQVVSQSDFDRRYRQVGALLDKLTNQRGDAAADALSKKYFSIPYADAIRSESVRRDADRALRTLASRIDKELKK